MLKRNGIWLPNNISGYQTEMNKRSDGLNVHFKEIKRFIKIFQK